ncbi:MBL fold metallo-hydrolase [Salinispora mooreana]|uniref:MBL fold metallo-hydrolase n=1 Tax=Salinispora mooreana TaxID=999545 RepID=UPI0003AAF13E|nr:MBL fold metallo-hydrolase [Salinispora mooreana]
MLKATLLGHQSWAIADDSTALLVDPVITRTFGNSELVRFEIWPPREVILDQIPDLAAIVITNEHLDHFHLESLALLRDRVSQLYVAHLFPAVAEEAARQLGFEVCRLPTDTEVSIGTLKLTFLPPDFAQIPTWESRCSSPRITTSDRTQQVVVQSDTLLKPDAALTASIVIATHNGQLRPTGWKGGLDNAIESSRSTELDILRELAVSYLAPFERTGLVTFSGGSYRHLPRRHAPFEMSDFAVLADKLNSLSFGHRFHGLHPGETLAADGTLSTVSWIAPAKPLVSDGTFTDRLPGDLSIGPIVASTEPAEDVLNVVLTGLSGLDRLIAATDFGQRIVDVNHWMGANVAGDERFVIHLRQPDGKDIACFYDINEARFLRPIPSPSVVQLALSVPFGMSCWVQDLAKVFDGTIQIWELATTAALQWYPGESRYSPIGFLFEALSEPLRPALTRVTYERVLRRCSMNATPA